MTKRKSPQLKRRRRPDRVRARARNDKPDLPREWIQEIERRVRDSRDPVRYMLVSEFSRSFILYYDVSGDVFVVNAPAKGTLFKQSLTTCQALMGRHRVSSSAM